MCTSSAHRLGEPHTSSPCYAIGRVTAFSKSATGKTDVSFNIKPAYVTFTVRGIIGTEERTFRGWVTHKYTKSHDRLANANKAAAPRTGARGSGADTQKLHHARRVAAAERRASVPTESRAARGGGGCSVGC